MIPTRPPVQSSYSRSRDYAQWEHLDGAPVGSRGGIVTTHTFLADGEYVFRAGFLVDETGGLFGNRGLDEKVEVAIDGQRVALLDVNPWMMEQDPQGATVESDPILIRAGQRTVSAAFIKRFEGPVQDIFAPIEATVAATTEGGRSPGITALPHMGSLTITGPYDAAGVSDNPVRERIFTCRPASPEEEGPCARQIIGNIAAQAYRRHLADHELEELVSMYESRAADAGFEEGIRGALQAILSSPHFVFRIEEQPQDVEPGEAFAINDFDLATRLAQFLWARPPDDELRGLAAEQKLSDEGVLEAQVERMLDDPRSESLATRFAAQWLRLPDLKVMRPDPRYFPYIDEGIKDGMRRETELFFYNIVEEDRPVTELMTADYTFINEDLAEHYGISGVTGEDFRRVQHTDEERYGLLGQASILTQTSFARRTSPVNRGKFVMEVLLGTAPPPPPPNIPDLDVTDSVDGASGARPYGEGTDGDASHESYVQRVPPVHRSSGVAVGGLRTHGREADSGTGLGDGAGSDRLSRDPLDGPAGGEPESVAGDHCRRFSGGVPPELHREPVEVWPRTSGPRPRPVHGPVDRPCRSRERLPLLVVRDGNRNERCISDDGKRDHGGSAGLRPGGKTA